MYGKMLLMFFHLKRNGNRKKKSCEAGKIKKHEERATATDEQFWEFIKNLHFFLFHLTQFFTHKILLNENIMQHVEYVLCILKGN